MRWIKNTDGKQDAVLTMALLGFIFIVAKFIFSGFSFAVGSLHVSFGTVDAGTIGAIITPTLGAYVFRRYTDKKYPADVDLPVAPPSPPQKVARGEKKQER